METKLNVNAIIDKSITKDKLSEEVFDHIYETIDIDNKLKAIEEVDEKVTIIEEKLGDGTLLSANEHGVVNRDELTIGGLQIIGDGTYNYHFSGLIDDNNEVIFFDAVYNGEDAKKDANGDYVYEFIIEENEYYNGKTLVIPAYYIDEEYASEGKKTLVFVDDYTDESVIIGAYIVDVNDSHEYLYSGAFWRTAKYALKKTSNVTINGSKVLTESNVEKINCNSFSLMSDSDIKLTGFSNINIASEKMYPDDINSEISLKPFDLNIGGSNLTLWTAYGSTDREDGKQITRLMMSKNGITIYSTSESSMGGLYGDGFYDEGPKFVINHKSVTIDNKKVLTEDMIEEMSKKITELEETVRTLALKVERMEEDKEVVLPDCVCEEECHSEDNSDCLCEYHTPDYGESDCDCEGDCSCDLECYGDGNINSCGCDGANCSIDNNFDGIEDSEQCSWE